MGPRQWHPTPVLLPGKSHGQRSLVGCSPWSLEESDTTERLHFHFSLSCIGEGNGNPLQCSCLENPRNGGAWVVGCRLWGCTESNTTEVTQLSLAQALGPRPTGDTYYLQLHFTGFSSLNSKCTGLQGLQCFLCFKF